MPLVTVPADRDCTQMVIPVSKGSYFNTKSERVAPLCPYDMLYHPPDYDQKAARSDRQDPKIIRKHIWKQEFPKGISSTNHFMYGRPKWKPADWPTKEYVRVVVKNENPHMRLHHVLEWAVLLNEGKENICEQ